MVDAVIDWERLRDEGAAAATSRVTPPPFQPYDWGANDGRLASAKTVPAAEVDHCGGRIRRTPGTRRPRLISPSTSVLIPTCVRRGMRSVKMTRAGEASGSAARSTTSATVRPPAGFDLQLDDRHLS